jgi:HD-GYP domain-containing protein (c-di-GMP phosphodiesterase class II)
MSSKLEVTSVDLRSNQSKPAVAISADVLALGRQWVRACVEQGGATQAWFSKVDEKQNIHWIVGWPADVFPAQFAPQTLSDAIRFGRRFIFHDHTELISGGVFPVLKDGQVIGLLALISDQSDYFDPTTIAWIEALTGILSYSVLQTENQTKKMQAEFSINRILQSGLNLRDTLQAIFGILSDLVEIDGAIVLKYNAASQQFNLLASHGLDGRALAKIHLYIENGLTKRVIKERKFVRTEDMLDAEPNENYVNLLFQEGFHAHTTTPLINHRDLLGVLEIFWRETQHIDAWKLEILQMFGESITFAMEHSIVVEDLKRRNNEFSSTYTATIAGLSRALELRDLETEGHTRRVSALTLRLAEHVQIPPDQRASIQQGALLHDIGKLGIPDAILLKPGSLTPQEWKVMQQHPLYAYNILAPIINLRQALDIPLYHHEHWDGSGYPYGLKGEQIPLSARLFAIVDVYDALTSDRPYRSAWTRSQAIEYLREQSGQLFDPQVVTYFLEMVNEI